MVLMGLKPPKWSFLVEKDGKRISIWMLYLVYGAFWKPKKTSSPRRIQTSCAVDEQPVPVKRWAALKNQLWKPRIRCNITIANGNQSIPVNIMWYSILFHAIPSTCHVDCPPFSTKVQVSATVRTEPKAHLHMARLLLSRPCMAGHHVGCCAGVDPLRV